MTEDQVLSMYWESFRQEARERIQRSEELIVAQSSKMYREFIQTQELRAYPPDPEADGEFDKEDMKLLKKTFGKMKEVKVDA